VRSAVSICLASAVLTACQTYEPAPLGDRPELLSDVADLTISPSDLPLPEVGVHPFDPSRPLDMDEVAMIAVINNPDLKAARESGRRRRSSGVYRRVASESNALVRLRRPDQRSWGDHELCECNPGAGHRAAPAPMPREAPVTIATLVLSWVMFNLLSFIAGHPLWMTKRPKLN
jgi:hypothetical protein